MQVPKSSCAHWNSHGRTGRKSIQSIVDCWLVLGNFGNFSVHLWRENTGGSKINQMSRDEHMALGPWHHNLIPFLWRETKTIRWKHCISTYFWSNFELGQINLLSRTPLHWCSLSLQLALNMNRQCWGFHFEFSQHIIIFIFSPQVKTSFFLASSYEGR